MEIKFDKKTLKRLLFCAIGIIVVYWLLHDGERVRNVAEWVLGIMSPFIIGAVLAFILNVPLRAFEGLFKGIKQPILRRAIALVLTLLCFAIVIAAVFMLLIPELRETIMSIGPQLTKLWNYLWSRGNELLETHPNVKVWLLENFNLQSLDWSSLVQNVLNFLGDGISALLPQAVSAIGTLFTGLISAFIAVAFAIYALFQKEILSRQGRKILYAILPENVSDSIIRVLRLSNSTFSNFLSGQCVEVVILGSMFAIAMAIFNMPYVPLISVLVAVTAFIPVVGAWTGCIIGAFLIFVGNPSQAIWFVVMFIILQQIENNFIYPRVVGTSIGLSGMWVLVAVAIGGEMIGVVGMFLMIPIASVIYTLIRESVHKRLEKLDIDPEKLEAQPPDIKPHFTKKMFKKSKKKEKK